jgi:hypothetical protein
MRKNCSTKITNRKNKMSQNKNSAKHLSELKNHLQEGETIVSSIFGAYQAKRMGNDTVRNGVFAITQNRVIFFAKKMFGYDLESFKFDKISSIERSKNLMGHAITIYTSGNEVSIKWVNDGEFPEFMDAFDNALENKKVVA